MMINQLRLNNHFSWCKISPLLLVIAQKVIVFMIQ